MCRPMQGTQVQFLVRELRPHMLQGNRACAPQLLHTSVTKSTHSGVQAPQQKARATGKDPTC